jgi:Cu/Ag efflux protein CusF
MKIVTRLRLATFAVASAAAAGALWAASPAMAHGDMMKGMEEHCMSMMGMGKGMGQHSMSQLVGGTIESIDITGGTVTIAHAAMPAMDMPAMTMPFKVQDKEMLEPFSAGDAVRFELSKIGGEQVVTRLARASR